MTLNRSETIGAAAVALAVVAILLALAMVALGEDQLLGLPPELRTQNYAGGSCMHAAIQDVLKWHGLHNQADWWRRHKRGSFGVDRARGAMDQLGLRYAFTTSGDENFLEWCSRNGHGAAIHYYSMHAVTFRGYKDGYAVLQDNNRPKKLILIEKATFSRRWKAYGGRAITVVYAPYPPVPKGE